MAIIWIDPHAVDNGDGTYLSPKNGYTKLDCVNSGDEVRVMSKSVEAMTAKTITADFDFASNHYTLTNCSNLDGVSDNDLIMDDVTKMCGKIRYLSGNNIVFYSQAAIPMATGDIVTGRTFRIISDKVHSIQHNKGIIFGGDSVVENVTITDGWENETTRHTDKSFITLLSSGNTNYFAVSFEWKQCSVDLSNTCVLPGYTGSSAYSKIIIGNNNIDIVLHSLVSGNTNGGIFFLADTSYIGLHVVNYISYYGILTHSLRSANSFDIRIENLSISGSAYWYLEGFINSNFTINKLILPSSSSRNPAGVVENSSLTFTDSIHMRSAAILTALPVGEGMTLNIGSNMKVFKKHEETKDILYKFYLLSGINTDTRDVIDAVVINNSSQIKFLKNGALSAGSAYSMVSPVNSKANITTHTSVIRTDEDNGWFPYFNFTKNARFRIEDNNPLKSRDILCGASSTSPNYSISVSSDESVYKVSSPSMKFYLKTFALYAWTSEVVKVIQLPVENDGSVSYTVSCWVKSQPNVLASLTCQVMCDGNLFDTEMNIAEIEADWVKYSRIFTPSKSQIAELRINMLPKASGQFWISDVSLI